MQVSRPHERLLVTLLLARKSVEPFTEHDIAPCKYKNGILAPYGSTMEYADVRDGRAEWDLLSTHSVSQ